LFLSQVPVNNVISFYNLRKINLFFIRFYVKCYRLVRNIGLNKLFILISPTFLFLDLVLKRDFVGVKLNMYRLNLFSYSTDEIKYLYNIIKSNRFSDSEFIILHQIVGVYFLRSYIDIYANNITILLKIGNPICLDFDLINY
jgi:hypothetical protein